MSHTGSRTSSAGEKALATLADTANAIIGTTNHASFRRLAARVDLELLARVAEADCEGRTGRFDCSAMEWFRERAEALGVQHAPPAPILLGRHLIALGVKPGPAMGVILKQAYELQLDNGFSDLDGALAFARGQLPDA